MLQSYYQQAKTDPMVTSQVIRMLEARQLIVRTRHPRDTRALCVRVTDKGTQLLAKAIPIVEQIDCNLFSRLSDADQQTILRILTKLGEE